MYKKILLVIGVMFSLAACKDLIEPAIENNRQLEVSYDPNDSRFPYGLLLNAYNRIPTNSWNFNDVATDDAVTNDQTNSYLKMAQGQWTSINNPLNQWTNCYAAIQYINVTMGEIPKVKWTADSVVSKLFAMRVTGEAIGLRGMFMYYLLQAHAGLSDNGQLLGVPILTEAQGTTSNFNKPRAKFDECVKQIYSDLDSAIALLPLDFENQGVVPAKYGNVTVEQYNRAFGATFRGLFTARIAKAIKSKLALLAASPAYAASNAENWANAADMAAELIDMKGGLGGLAANGLSWYAATSEIAGLADGANPAEILWRNNYGDSRDLEQNNFPPTLYGNGRINPTQNLVDAFPMLNGYPISDPAGGYSAADPYSNRDPRLKLFVLVNGGTAGPNNTVINTSADGTTNDALNKVGTSTRTGYYLRKLLRQDVNLNPTSANNQRHYKPHIRYTEIFLNYAEAANEAWGPTGAGQHSYSAYDVIKAIRKRAGIGVSNGDAYLETSKGSQETMRQLIRNERRLELCFEGFRFWDLRRWKADLKEGARGISISGGVPAVIQVEDRVYQNYMIYGPIPYAEKLKYSALLQNAGWQ
ncbi:RagB/SusD family nutrient uptake outer membrane protein [Chitinophaga sp. Cy-1792]|uniref:RagB/SusD family nutrient uptake outer membrane protein n=1 Tax=Chitinophaga sp. Cy-1792 TaxID=2608339 RepID=UPI00141FA463|nr:RagB/SusD family nutrient uptake outer membrane protein [Chitinophaga sp. Cy-1792]NIG55043.1 RagB/SusD family nutrient uptake outer membrane protein [Chitinophaga sp. Cy-1792]